MYICATIQIRLYISAMKQSQTKAKTTTTPKFKPFVGRV